MRSAAAAARGPRCVARRSLWAEDICSEEGHRGSKPRRRNRAAPVASKSPLDCCRLHPPPQQERRTPWRRSTPKPASTRARTPASMASFCVRPPASSLGWLCLRLRTSLDGPRASGRAAG
eukprot:scaffold523_cov446-Prasinococcus_capsulatus_cf.AAC.14